MITKVKDYVKLFKNEWTKLNIKQIVYDFLFDKGAVVISLILVVIIALRKPLELLVDTYLVKNGISDIDAIWYNDISFFFLMILSIVLVWYRFNKYVPSLRLTIILTISSIIYLVYRINYLKWNFTSLSSFQSIKYFDIIVIFAICQLFAYATRLRQFKIIENPDCLFDDNSIGKDGEDSLGYQPYASHLGQKIMNSNFDKSFAIGVNGKWGIGKTSFIDLLKKTISGENIIEVNFNPWNSHTPQAIIKDFFDTIQEAIRPYHSNLSQLFIDYSTKLVALNSSTVTESLKAATTFFNIESINSLYTEINEYLTSINKKLVIYIDDLDRLDKNEIIEVIRLIRNTANFHSTFFIVAYDRNYVVNSLRQHNSYKQEEFLEKIFQIEVTLPYFNKDILRVALAKKLEGRFPNGYDKLLNQEIMGNESTVPIYLTDWLDTMRDVTRLANALILNLSSLNGEVVYNEFIRLELLRLKYPSVYELLFRQTKDFLAASGKTHRGYTYELIGISKTDNKNSESNFASHLEQYLFQHFSELSIPFKDVKKITIFVDSIFSVGSILNSTEDKRVHFYSVTYPSKFNRYFTYSLLEGALSEIEFSNARTLNQNDFNKYISIWVSQGLEREVKERFNEIKDFDNKEDYEKVISAIFYLANIQIDKENIYGMAIVGFDGSNLMEKFNNEGNYLIMKYYAYEGGILDFQKFVRGLFRKARSPYLFESGFINILITYHTYTFPIPIQEITSFAIGYLKSYCEEVDQFDNNLWRLYHHCKSVKYEPLGNGRERRRLVMPSEAKAVLIDFITRKDTDGFLKAIIHFYPFDGGKYAISDSAKEIFGDWVHFVNFINNINESESRYINEFKQFMGSFVNAEFTSYIHFDFKIIPVQTV